MIETIADIDPSKIYTTAVQYKAIKYAKHNVPFEIEDKDIANQLIVIDLVKEEKHRVHLDKESMTEEEYQEYILCQDYQETGKYLLSVKGEYVVEYKKAQNITLFWNEFRAWFTMVMSLVAIVVSIIAIILKVDL